jgi:hypothetical protein
LIVRRPPLLPIEALRRVLRLAWLDGASVLGIAAAVALYSASRQDELGTIVGLAVAAAGAIELHGVSLLRHGMAHGMRWLIISQFALMGVILTYVGRQLGQVDASTLAAISRMLTDAMPPDQLQQLQLQTGMGFGDLVHSFYRSLYELLGFLTVLYQGCMALHYCRRTPAVAAALHEPA